MQVHRTSNGIVLIVLSLFVPRKILFFKDMTCKNSFFLRFEMHAKNPTLLNVEKYKPLQKNLFCIK